MILHAILVDDEQLAIDGLTVFPWESYGVELAAAFLDPRAAFAWCKSHPVDVVIADVRMPGMTGIELAAAMRSSLPDVLVILLSGHSEFSFAQEALRHGVFRYVLKPIDDEEFGLALQDAADVLAERENQKHWTKRIARDFWFRERLLDRRVASDAQDLALLDHGDDGEREFAVFVVTTERDLTLMIQSVEGVRGCSTLRHGEWTVLVGIESCEEFCAWLERHDLHAGMSRSQRGTTNLREAFLEARNAAAARFVMPDRCLIRSEDIPVADQKMVCEAMVEAGALAEKIAMLDDADCSAEVRGLFERLIRYGASADAIRRAAFFLAVGVQRLLAVGAGGRIGTDVESAIASIPDLFSLIDDAYSVHELATRFTDATAAVQATVFRLRSQERADARLSRALDFIHRSYRSPISLDDVADHVGMNASRFSVWFKSRKGMNYIDYLTQYRIENAKRLLLLGGSRIRDVAEQTGFGDPRYFGQVFKRLVGVTPGRFQLLHRPCDTEVEINGTLDE